MTDDSWKRTHLRDPNQKPLAVCPHCDWKAYSVVSAWGKASHMWQCHGIPGEFTMNGKTTRYGPESMDPDPVIHLKEYPVKSVSPLMRWWGRFRLWIVRVRNSLFPPG